MDYRELFRYVVVGAVIGTAIGIVFTSAATPLQVKWLIGDSMRPTSPPNSLLVCVEQDEYEVGDFVSYTTSYSKNGISHRIVQKVEVKGRSDWFQLKGDNNPRVDPWWVAESQVNCRYLGGIHFGIPPKII